MHHVYPDGLLGSKNEAEPRFMSNLHGSDHVRRCICAPLYGDLCPIGVLTGNVTVLHLANI
jgi:hypothetical protein